MVTSHFKKQSNSFSTNNYMDNVLSAGGPMNSSWPMQSHDNLHTGRSQFSTANNPGVEKWRFLCDQVDGGPVIAEDGTIYFGVKGYPTYLYALNPDGTLKWKHQLGNDVYWVWSTPAIADDGTIYIGTMFDGGFYALNPDGSQRWHYNFGDSIASSPAISPEGTIYFGTENGYLYALNPNGTLKWRYPAGTFITSDPAIGLDGTIYIGSFDTYLYAIRPNGTLKWRFKTGDIIKGQASIAPNGTVYIGSFDDYLYALYPNNGTMKWECRFGMGSEGTPAIALDGTIYVGSDKLYAVYPNGTIRWRFILGSSEYVTQSAPAVSADGTIYVGTNIDDTDGGNIIAVNPDGTERWRKWIANDWIRSSPAIGSDGTVYIGSASANQTDAYGFLHAFGRGPLKIDIGGPYLGLRNEPVQFQCTVFGGIPPYSYAWSFGDGGTSTNENPTHTYTLSGVYTVTLLVTDAEGNSSMNSTTATISSPPYTPQISGPPRGKINQAYNYTVVTTDPENDDVFYYISWGDDSHSSWVGPYKSGEEIIQTHTWTKRGLYTIQCKAKDIYGWESGWATLKITMPMLYEPPHFRFLDWLFERSPNAFPILRYLLRQ